MGTHEARVESAILTIRELAQEKQGMSEAAQTLALNAHIRGLLELTPDLGWSLSLVLGSEYQSSFDALMRNQEQAYARDVLAQMYKKEALDLSIPRKGSPADKAIQRQKDKVREVLRQAMRDEELPFQSPCNRFDLRYTRDIKMHIGETAVYVRATWTGYVLNLTLEVLGAWID